jgi:hypothetical protein
MRDYLLDSAGSRNHAPLDSRNSIHPKEGRNGERGSLGSGETSLSHTVTVDGDGGPYRKP